MKIVTDIPDKKWELIQDNQYCGIIDDLLYQNIKNGKPLERYIEDIKAEIERRADDYLPSGSYDGDLYNGAYRDALYWCFDLLDKHISGKENE